MQLRCKFGLVILTLDAFVIVSLFPEDPLTPPHPVAQACVAISYFTEEADMHLGQSKGKHVAPCQGGANMYQGKFKI